MSWLRNILAKQTVYEGNLHKPVVGKSNFRGNVKRNLCSRIASGITCLDLFTSPVSGHVTLNEFLILYLFKSTFFSFLFKPEGSFLSDLSRIKLILEIISDWCLQKTKIMIKMFPLLGLMMLFIFFQFFLNKVKKEVRSNFF